MFNYPYLPPLNSALARRRLMKISVIFVSDAFTISFTILFLFSFDAAKIWQMKLKRRMHSSKAC